MEMDLSKYTIEELVELKDLIDNRIYSYDDGFIYICKVRSYGRNWNENGITNTHTLQELCLRYDGDNGIVDVYTNNPNLSVYNYGDLMYIKSKDDYAKWGKYQSLKNNIFDLEKEWEEWDNKDNIPFYQRPYFAPIYSKEDIEKMKTELENFDMDFTEPVSITPKFDDVE